MAARFYATASRCERLAAGGVSAGAAAADLRPNLRCGLHMTRLYADREGLTESIESLEGVEWDAGDSEKNWKRHRVTQGECEQVFANLPLVLSVSAKATGAERRYFALGRTDASRELAVRIEDGYAWLLAG